MNTSTPRFSARRSTTTWLRCSRGSRRSPSEVYHDDCRIHAMNPNRYIRNHEHLTRSPVQVVERFADIDLPIIKILFEEDFPVLDAVRTFILSRPWGREYELIYSNEHLLELTAAGATKGGMILRLASLLGVARKDIYCIGDHKNDIPMLEVSAVPFAPANAIPAVHEFGAHIVSHCSDGAVADVVEYLDKIY
ncbi:MAG: HAD family hydrolase [Oscillospiraceae bacterium]